MASVIADFNVELDKKRVCSTLGYNNGHRPRASFLSLVDECLEEADHLIHPFCAYQIMDVKRVRRPRVTLVNGLKLTVSSEVLSWALAPCQQALVFVSSIGRQLEERVAQLTGNGQMRRAMILDAIGSEAVEKTVCFLQNQVRAIANADDAEITLRYSPGYCDWDIEQQRLLFRAMDSAPLEVDLTEDCLMVPQKSLSGIIGIGWGEKRRLRLSPCRFCTNVGCQNRR